MGWLGNAFVKPQIHLKAWGTCAQDGYIDKDELYFLLDRVGTFKKAKWSLAQFILRLQLFRSIKVFATCAGPICTRHWTSYWQAERALHGGFIQGPRGQGLVCDFAETFRFGHQFWWLCRALDRLVDVTSENSTSLQFISIINVQ